MGKNELAKATHLSRASAAARVIPTEPAPGHRGRESMESNVCIVKQVPLHELNRLTFIPGLNCGPVERRVGPSIEFLPRIGSDPHVH